MKNKILKMTEYDEKLPFVTDEEKDRLLGLIKDEIISTHDQKREEALIKTYNLWGSSKYEVVPKNPYDVEIPEGLKLPEDDFELIMTVYAIHIAMVQYIEKFKPIEKKLTKVDLENLKVILEGLEIHNDTFMKSDLAVKFKELHFTTIDSTIQEMKTLVKNLTK